MSAISQLDHLSELEAELKTLSDRDLCLTVDNDVQLEELGSRYAGVVVKTAVLREIYERWKPRVTRRFGGPGKPCYVLYEDNFAAHLGEMKEMEGDMSRYFHFGSKLWTAIQKHIVYAKDCVLIERPGKVVVHSSGYGISFRDIYRYVGDYKQTSKGTLHTPSKHYSIVFTVEYVPLGDDDEDRARRKEFTLHVPISLEMKFSDKAFDQWVKSLKKKRDAEKPREKDLEKLHQLMEKYPDVAKSFVKG